MMNNPRPNNLTTKSFVIFLHIQKAGGITLQRILRRKLGPSLLTRALHLMSAEQKSSSLEMAMKSKRQEDRFFAAHCCFGVHRCLPQPSTYITFLREPVSRIISLYYYSHHNPTAYYHAQAAGKSLAEFAIETPLMELDNGQVRFLAGDRESFFINRTPVGGCTTDLLETAKHHIDTYFSFVGLTEHFDQSILLLARIMGWKECLYLRRNTAKQTQKVISQDIIQQIAARNALDIQLYQYAQQKFFESLKTYQLLEASLLETFQARNQFYNSLWGRNYDLYDNFKARFKEQLGRP